MSLSPSKTPSICVILGYYKGQEFIKDQITSILNQENVEVKVYVFDDTPEIGEGAYLQSLDPLGKDRIIYNKNPVQYGFCRNFLNGLASVSDDYDYYAFSDQDDVWLENKLDKAVKALSATSPKTPGLYCGRTATYDEQCKRQLGLSPLFKKPPSFGNALVQSIAGANTMVMNRAAKQLVVSASKNLEVVSHDWWCYQLITGVDGHVTYDATPYIKYRQHGSNIVGSNNNFFSRIVRLKGLLNGKFQKWNDINILALNENKLIFSPQNKLILEKFAKIRNENMLKRLLHLSHGKIYRQTVFGNIGLLFGVLLKKI